MIMLWWLVNPLTAVLTFLSLIGYAVLYTVWLKHVTPQNIVIGGAAGAAPPVLGWTAVTGSADPHSLLLFLIIFAWTPPHFWALAIARRKDYAKAGIPMLPVAYGVEFTQLHILLYTILLFIVTLLPYLTGMSGLLYLAAAVVLGVDLHALRHRDAQARRAGPAAHAGVPLFDQLPDAAVRGAAGRSLPARSVPDAAMAGRSTHFAAPLLLAVDHRPDRLRLAVSVPLRRPTARRSREALRSLSWARAGRGDMFNNVLLYVPFGFCVALLVEPRWGRVAGIVAGTLLGAALSLGLELLQASVAIRVSSLRDLSLNAAGSLLGAVLGTVFHALGSRVSPQGTPRSRSAFVAMSILVLWLLERLWPLLPDPGLRQLKRAVRPLLTPHIEWMALAGFFVGWLVVAQVVFGLVEAAARDGRVPDRDRDGAGRPHVRRRQHARRGRDRGHRAAVAAAGAAQPARGRHAFDARRGAAGRVAGLGGRAAAARRRTASPRPACPGCARCCCATCRRRRCWPTRPSATSRSAGC